MDKTKGMRMIDRAKRQAEDLFRHHNFHTDALIQLYQVMPRVMKTSFPQLEKCEYNIFEDLADLDLLVSDTMAQDHSYLDHDGL